MQFAIVSGTPGVVLNIAEAASPLGPEWIALSAALRAQIGDSWDGMSFTTAPPDPTMVSVSIEDALDAELDAIAQSWGYKNSNRLAGYVNSTVAKWQAEAQAFIAGRDAWWTKAASIQAAWTPGSPVPTYDAVRAQMPAIVRPT